MTSIHTAWDRVEYHSTVDHKGHFIISRIWARKVVRIPKGKKGNET